MSQIILDIEVYRNYFLASTLDVATGEVCHYEAWPEESFDANGLLDATRPAQRFQVDQFLAAVEDRVVVTFNGAAFDMQLLAMACRGKSCLQIKAAADRIIKENLRAWQSGEEPLSLDHIDLIEVAPGIASLKTYAARLHVQSLQDLPIEPDAYIEAGQRQGLREYCERDLRATLALYEKLRPQIELRAEMGQRYGIDLRSRSDAQIAEAIIRHEIEEALGHRPAAPAIAAGEVLRYQPPAWLSFASQTLRDALATVVAAEFVVEESGAVRMPAALDNLVILIAAGAYRMGIGGLHSSEQSTSHRADANFALVDRDVASYYPSIILSCGLFPQHLGSQFRRVYADLVERRLKAKRAGDKVVADVLKIVVNGTFGKLGSPYSIVYSPRLLIQTTITGQLALLMLIEKLEGAGIAVVSANTDGIVIRPRRGDLWLMDALIESWEATTGFATEETQYAALFSRDVNNYVAIKAQGGAKLKGVYAAAGLAKNPAGEIIQRAVVAHLEHGADIEATIRECRDIRQFLFVRSVKGGAVKGDVYLGRTARWYYAKGETGTINYRTNGNKVPRTDGARPCMELPADFPPDVDIDWYVTEAQSILEQLAAVNIPKTEVLWKF